MVAPTILTFNTTFFIDARLKVQSSSSSSSKPTDPPHPWRIKHSLPSKLSGTVVNLADLNGDGTLDVLTDHRLDSERRVEAWMNNGVVGIGGLKFSPAIDLPIHQTNVFTTGDMNGDGLSDIIVGRKYQFNQVHINNHNSKTVGIGDEGVEDEGDYRIIDIPETGGAVASETKSIAVADIDGDGHLDIIERDTRRNRILINDGTGENYSIVPLPSPVDGNKFVIGNSKNIAVADMDGDGKREIIFCDLGSGKNILLKNNGSKGFDAVELPGSEESRSIAVEDVNGDGFLDIVLGLNPVVLLNSGDGVNYDVVKLPDFGDIVKRVNEVALGDFNGDGLMDYIYCGVNGPLVLINRGDGSVDLYSIPNFGESGFISMALGDVDGDGIIDLAMAHSKTNQSHLLLLSAGDELDRSWYDSISVKNIQDLVVLSLVLQLVLLLICMCCKKCRQHNKNESSKSVDDSSQGGGVMRTFMYKINQKLGLNEGKKSEMTRLQPEIRVI